MPIVPQGRVCTHCGEWKPASEFKRVSGQPHKLRAWCKPCTLADQQRYRDKRVVRVCADCGKQYECRNADSRYCELCGTARRYANLEQGEAMRLVCRRCGEVFPSESSKRQFCSLKCKGEASQGRATSKRGKQYPHTQRAAVRVCPGCGVEFRAVKDTKRKQQYYCSHTCYLRCRRVSKFEADVMDRLEAAGLQIERQARRGRWSFDGAIIGSNLLIEADGVFWHSSDQVKARDARKDAWAASQGYTVLRVPEMDYRANPTATLNVILRRAEAEGLSVERVNDNP